MAHKQKQPLKNAPAKPGFYWALWTSSAKKTHEGKDLKLPAHADDWQVVEVFQNHIGQDDNESLAVFVGGVRYRTIPYGNIDSKLLVRDTYGALVGNTMDVVNPYRER